MTAITQLAIGEALVSVLDETGAPTPVERIWMAPPESQIGPLNNDEYKQHVSSSPMAGRYEQIIDRESAYELLEQRAEQKKMRISEQNQQNQDVFSKPATQRKQSSRASSRESIGEALLKSFGRSVASGLGRRIVRGLLGSLLGK